MKSETEDDLQSFIKRALLEDVGEGDHTSLSTIPKGKKGSAYLLIKENGIIAGIEVAVAIFHAVDATLKVEVHVKDGDFVRVGDLVLHVQGSIHSILMAERLVLNVMQRMSGIATLTHKVVQSISDTGAKVLDTRKTTPGLRFLEKEAVKIGGGANHRFGLYDMILIKDNHVDYAGGIKEALNAAKKYREDINKDLQIEIEVRNLEELEEVLESGNIDRILLDNFDYDTLREAVRRVNRRAVVEASGGITFENARRYAECGVDYISMGALTHSVKSLDMSLKAESLSVNSK